LTNERKSSRRFTADLADFPIECSSYSSEALSRARFDEGPSVLSPDKDDGMEGGEEGDDEEAGEGLNPEDEAAQSDVDMGVSAEPEPMSSTQRVETKPPKDNPVISKAAAKFRPISTPQRMHTTSFTCHLANDLLSPL
jgi:hypothetical protein